MSFLYLTRKRPPSTPGRVKAVQQYYGPGWRKIRKAVLERDDHECQWCGSILGLQVHHIEKIQLFYDPRTDTIDYETANALDNLTTLCISCHRAADGHSTLDGFQSL